MPGTLSPLPRVSDPDMHHGTCVMHVPGCMPGSLTSDFIWIQWRGKCSRHSRRVHNPQFYVSGKRPMNEGLHCQHQEYMNNPIIFEYGVMCCMLSSFHVSSRIAANISESSLPSFLNRSLGLAGGHYQTIYYSYLGTCLLKFCFYRLLPLYSVLYLSFFLAFFWLLLQYVALFQSRELDVIYIVNLRALSPWESEPVNNKETGGLPTSRPLSSMFVYRL